MTDIFVEAVNRSIAAGWLVLAVVVLRLALRRGPRWVNLLLWGMVALRLLCPISIESRFSLVPDARLVSEKFAGTSFWAVLFPGEGVAEKIAVSPEETDAGTEGALSLLKGANAEAGGVFSFLKGMDAEAGGVFSFLKGMDVEAGGVFSFLKGADAGAEGVPSSQSGANTRAGGMLSSRPGADAGAGDAPFSPGETDNGRRNALDGNIVSVLTIVWLSGVGLMLLYAMLSYLRLCRQVSTAVLFRDNIYSSERVKSPFVLGVVRPRIYIPFQMNEGHLEMVTLHEQTHIRRGDHLWKPIGFGLLALYWFHPLLWLAYVLLCRDIELACDERVIRGLGRKGRADYSQALLDCSVHFGGIRVCPLAFGEAGVKTRVKSVLNYRKPGFLAVLLATVVCVAAAVCFLTDPIHSDMSVQAQGPGAGTAADIYHSGLSSGDEGFPEGEASQPYSAGQPASEDAAELMDAVIWEEADLDRDGEPEIIRVREETKGEAYILEVLKEDGTLLWSEMAGTAQGDWNTLLLYQEDGEDYLIRYRPNFSQGYGNFICEQFYLDSGVGRMENAWKADFELASGEVTWAMRAFAERANEFLEKGTVLLSTLEGELAVGPRKAEELSWLYPVRFYYEGVETVPAESVWADFAVGLSEDVPPLELILATGASAWDTSITLYPDGSFQGRYWDSENIASEDYPRGTVYICNFSGRFDEITKKDEYTFSLHLAEFQAETEADSEWIEDGTRYIGSEPFGMEGGEEFILYLPGVPITELDEAFGSWSPDYYLWRNGGIEKLSSYGLYNVGGGYGFFTNWD